MLPLDRTSDLTLTSPKHQKPTPNRLSLSVISARVSHTILFQMGHVLCKTIPHQIELVSICASADSECLWQTLYFGPYHPTCIWAVSGFPSFEELRTKLIAGASTLVLELFAQCKTVTAVASITPCCCLWSCNDTIELNPSYMKRRIWPTVVSSR